jgi:PAS domain S-box-containing protein
MAGQRESTDETLRENQELRLRLEEAEETLRAIRSGQVDAFVVERPQGDEVYTLETADRPYRLFVEAMQHGAATLSKDGTILFCNDYMANLLNTPTERLTGAALRDSVVEEDRAVFDASIMNGQGEVDLRLGGNATVPVHLTVHAIPEDGPSTTYCVLVSDLTQQRLFEDLKRTEEALRETEERFRMLAENMDQLAWICDELGNCIWYNQRWLDYTGLSFEDMRGWGWRQVQHPDYVNSVVQSIKRAGDAGEPWEDTFPLRGKDGDYRWFLSRAVPIRDEAGQTARWFGTNTDVTEQLRIQDELRKVAAEMAAANRRKTEFLAILGHELRNPLAPMRSGLEVMKTLKDPEKIEEVRATIERQTIHLTCLLDDLLDVSRIAQGKMTLEKRRVPISEVIRSAVEEVLTIIEEAGQELTITGPQQPPSLDADPNRLAQILSNLLNNASKYTPKGGHIRLSVSSQEDSVVITVKDDGIGIPLELQSSVFEMFSQIDRPLEKGYRGLGIGLTLVKRLVEMHGGTIWVNSAGLGTGSEFRLRFPQPDVVPTMESGGQADDAGVAAGSPPSGAGSRVLVVDDNTAAAEMLSLVVKMLGSEVRTAYDGQEAIQLAAEFRPDVVLMDIGMPRMDGYEAARRIRQQPWGEKMELVALTGWGQNEDKQRTADAGFNHHWVKPAEPAAIQALIAAHSHEPRVRTADS